MTEKHRPRRDRLEEGLVLGSVVRDAYADQGLCGISGPRPMTDEVRRVAVPAETLEHHLELIEAPRPFISAVQHHDVPGHDVSPFPLIFARGGPHAGQLQDR